MTINAVRAGDAARYWSSDPYDEELSQGEDQIAFSCKMPSKGGGTTEVKISVTSDSFEEVAKAMFGTNEDAAVLAFVSTESFGPIIQAMMDADEDHAIGALGLVLRHNKDATVGACGAILLDKSDSRKVSDPN
jgi:hypothetical protein